MMVMVKQNLVTSPSFLSTARALLSIHCRESMCAFNTCRRVVSCFDQVRFTVQDIKIKLLLDCDLMA